MNYERNKKYFEQNIPVWPTVVSFALLALGAFVFIFFGFSKMGKHGIFIPIGLFMMVAGLIGFVILSNIKLKDSEVDEQLPELEEQFKRDFNDKFTVTNAAKLRYMQTYGTAAGREIKFEPVWLFTYSFDHKDAMHKTGTDSKSRSSVYSLSAFALKPDCLCIGKRSVSLISKDSPDVDLFREIKYEELAGCELVKSEKTGYSGQTKYRHLKVTLENGETVAELPVLADASADEDVDEINVRIKRKHETRTN